jgi:kynurenine formamidase
MEAVVGSDAALWRPLGHILHDGLPASSSGSIMFRAHERPFGLGRAITVTRVEMSVHTGTHVDAARHFLPDGRSIDEYDVATFVGSGIALDLRRVDPGPVALAELAEAGRGVREDDIVLLCFGWGRRFGRPEYRDHPFLSVEAAGWLVDRGAKVVGMDTPGPDMPDHLAPEGFIWPVHQLLLEHDIPIIEHLAPALEALCGLRLEVNAMPIRIAGSDGGPCSPIARPIA